MYINPTHTQKENSLKLKIGLVFKTNPLISHVSVLPVTVVCLHRHLYKYNTPVSELCHCLRSLVPAVPVCLHVSLPYRLLTMSSRGANWHTTNNTRAHTHKHTRTHPLPPSSKQDICIRLSTGQC